MSEILLKAEDARSAAGEMRNRASTAQEQFTATRTRLTDLASSFKGKTATVFDAKFEEWRASANNLIESLNGLSSFLDSAANTIEEADQNVANQLNG